WDEQGVQIPEQYSAGSAWRGNRRMTRLSRHPATYRPMALTLPGLCFYDLCIYY
ncbi:hypothetical protein GS026_004730, partial [Salmonella enterica]|nr:hypothetical protein [Salmonella enterica]EEC5297989.1 hypothetical protein [Salmonella enterica subsp. enterica serovar Blockley]